jgi:hypothetical protein
MEADPDLNKEHRICPSYGGRSGKAVLFSALLLLPLPLAI